MMTKDDAWLALNEIKSTIAGERAELAKLAGMTSPPKANGGSINWGLGGFCGSSEEARRIEGEIDAAWREISRLADICEA